MREIRFRGKRLDTGEWVYGYLFEDIATNRRLSYIIKSCLMPALCMSADRFIEVDTGTVGQFTGLNDKTGKEMFGGDLVEAVHESGRFVYEIVWEKYNCRLEFVAVNFKSTMSKNMGSIYTEVSVIGNRFENPDLLKS